ncbi:tyrosine-type recombinase/integrase [Pollutimonas subterranea]|uniref:tyrosine-type recombinase/integrase n=1 Tax=Pollutimonas subterranea TaxID=2045210 RepID=UPI0013044EDD|nr:tyrosine-type recombinase/integrase [Pollutimonas subterranea]
METTYSQLQEAHRDRLNTEKGEVSEQVLRNHTSVLKSFLVFCNKTMENRVGREFTFDFIKQVSAYGELAGTHNRKTAADKVSILRAWKKTVDLATRVAKLKPVAGPSLFHKELRAAIAMSGQTTPDITKAIHTAPLTIQGWLNGEFPFKRGLPALRRLEAHLGLERGHLESKLEYPRKDLNVTIQQSGDKYMERMRANRQDPFYLKSGAFTPELTAEWFALMRYKTAEHTVGLRRTARGVWRALPIDKVGADLGSNKLCHPAPGLACPSAERNLLTVRSYLGFLAKSRSENVATSGLGLPDDHVQTLGMLVIPEFVNAFFEFMKARSGNIVHNGHNNVAGAICNLTRPDDGYLWQQPAFLAKVETYAKGRSWRELCDETYRLCKSWQQASLGKKSRDPRAPLLTLLSLADPLGPFKNAIKKLDMAAARCAPGSAFQATYKRDALLLALALSNPLRHRTLTITKYVAPGVVSEYETNLFQTEKGSWRLQFFSGDFKNDRSKQIEYDAPLPQALSKRIEEYLAEYRPVLVRRNPTAPWVFPNLHGNKHKDVGQLIATIAQNYIPEVGRLRMHALRHIVATDFLNRNPGQYTVIASLLHDNLETVLKHYAHRKVESAFKAHEEHLKGFFDGI